MKSLYLENQQDWDSSNIAFNGNRLTVQVSTGIDDTIHSKCELRITKEQKQSSKQQMNMVNHMMRL